ncbi:hypothetical protein FQZ97_881300 [compost metagenome]
MGVGEQRGAVAARAGCQALGPARLQLVRRRQQTAEHRVEREELHQVPQVGLAGGLLGDESLRLAGQPCVALHGSGEVSGDSLGAVRGPVRVGAQEQRIPGLFLLQAGEQVGGEDAAALRRVVQPSIERALLSARPFFAQVLRVQPCFRRDDRQQQFDPVPV